MKASLSIVAFSVTLASLIAASPIDLDDALRVNTAGGTVLGMVNGSFPSVRQFLKVPYAQPPIGDLRWLPSHPVNDSNRLIDSSSFGPSCPQKVANGRNIGSVDARAFRLDGTFSEDCLTLAIWTPLNPKKSLPVFLWVYGGGYETGGINTPYQDAAPWVQRTSNLVFVAINYRTNILGFPGASGLMDQNLGLLDIRQAAIWARENIVAFGGDPERMVFWGQSSGGGSIDILNFAFPDDPIVGGFIADSGSAFLYNQKSDPSYSNFSIVADYFNCTNPIDSDVLSCMKAVSWPSIEAFLTNYTDGVLNFVPFIDNRIVFANYSVQYANGHISSAPAIFGSNLLEGNQIATYPDNPATESPNTTVVTYFTEHAFLCPAYLTSKYRTSSNLTTFRYEYDGNFTNISPHFWEGAYHGSELPLLFGTYDEYNTEIDVSAFEVETSMMMQDLWVAFAKDPKGGVENGVNGGSTWLPYSQGYIEVFGGKNIQGADTVMQAVPWEDIDSVCEGAVDDAILSGENPFSSFS